MLLSARTPPHTRKANVARLAGSHNCLIRRFLTMLSCSEPAMGAKSGVVGIPGLYCAASPETKHWHCLDLLNNKKSLKSVETEVF